MSEKTAEKKPEKKTYPAIIRNIGFTQEINLCIFPKLHFTVKSPDIKTITSPQTSVPLTGTIEHNLKNIESPIECQLRWVVKRGKEIYENEWENFNLYIASEKNIFTIKDKYIQYPVIDVVKHRLFHEEIGGVVYYEFYLPRYPLIDPINGEKHAIMFKNIVKIQSMAIESLRKSRYKSYMGQRVDFGLQLYHPTLMAGYQFFIYIWEAGEKRRAKVRIKPLKKKSKDNKERIYWYCGCHFDGKRKIIPKFIYPEVKKWDNFSYKYALEVYNPKNERREVIFIKSLANSVRKPVLQDFDFKQMFENDTDNYKLTGKFLNFYGTINWIKMNIMVCNKYLFNPRDAIYKDTCLLELKKGKFELQFYITGNKKKHEKAVASQAQYDVPRIIPVCNSATSFYVLIRFAPSFMSRDPEKSLSKVFGYNTKNHSVVTLRVDKGQYKTKFKLDSKGLFLCHTKIDDKDLIK